MTDFTIPESLKAYYTEPGVKNAVNALVDKLDGKNPPELSWEEARQYNKALLMAAQVRADLVDLLFGVWEATFGADTGVCKLGCEHFYFEDNSVAKIWEDKELCRTYYRKDNNELERKNDDLKNDDLYVAINEKDKIVLQVYRYKNKDYDSIDLASTADVDGWKKIEDDDETYVETNKAVPMVDFIENPTKHIGEFHALAKTMIAALLKE